MQRILLFIIILTTSLSFAQSRQLFRHPTLNGSTVAFRYADDIWTVPRAGGTAARLTSTGRVVGGPYFSPDGKELAYAQQVNGERRVFTIPVEGGLARRITYQPDGSDVVGWTPDGNDLLVASQEKAVRGYLQLFRVHADGSGLPQQLPLPSGTKGSYSRDGSRIAYNPFLQWQEGSWKQYRGGQTEPIWIADLKTLDVEEIPRSNSNDRDPLWDGDTIYFLSDRSGPVSLFSYDTHSKLVRELLRNHGLDLDSFSVYKGSVVYEQFGSLHLLELSSGTDEPIGIQISGDLPALEQRIQSISASEIQNVSLSPTGKIAVLEAHGEIFTIPVKDGDAHNVTNSSNAAEREPAWSADGQRIAYFSDAHGEYQLVVKDIRGVENTRFIDLGPSPTYYYAPRWSPDSKRILFSDQHLNLWYVDLESAVARPLKIATDEHEGFGPKGFQAAFSPDGRWILYLRSLPSMLNAAFLYSLDSGSTTQLSDGMSHVTNAIWDSSGKYIFFTASTDSGPTIDTFGLVGRNLTTTFRVYLALLDKSEPSPIQRLRDEETDHQLSHSNGTQFAARHSSTIELDGIQQRIISLPIPARNYTSMALGPSGVLLLGESSNAAANPSDDAPALLRKVWRFDLNTQTLEDVLDGASCMITSSDGEKLLYKKADQYYVASLNDMSPETAGATAGQRLKTEGLQALVNPRSEWKQIFEETLRIEREFFYDPHLHGLDIERIRDEYAPYIEGLSTRSDLTYLQNEVLGQFRVGHMFVHDPPHAEHGPKVGLLGADYEIANGRYRITHIVRGSVWDPEPYAPLSQPGINVKEGDYLLAVNGIELRASDNLYKAFDGLANKEVTITVGPSPGGGLSRDLRVVATASEHAARQQEWIDTNINKVEKLSGGQVAYVYIPNTGGEGFKSFNRYFFAQSDKKAVLIDDRYNQGGNVPDYVIEVLMRRPMLNYIGRDGPPVTEPTGAIFGPKAMLINQNAGSGGDAMPWLFRNEGLGILVGTRTWGGLIGVTDYPVLLDGGTVTAPSIGIYGLNDRWEVENVGVSPDIEVQEYPRSAADGHDPQLERAVTLLIDEMRKRPAKKFPSPPYPVNQLQDHIRRPKR